MKNKHYWMLWSAGLILIFSQFLGSQIMVSNPIMPDLGEEMNFLCYMVIPLLGHLVSLAMLVIYAIRTK